MKIKSIFLFLAVAWFAFGSASFAVADPNRPLKPNIVIIFADDLGFGDLGCYGATRIHTPNIDQLARDGMRFTDAHAAASLCSPSRYGLLTGHSPWCLHRKGNGYRLTPDRLTMARFLQDNGYTTAAVGKWHLGYSRDWNMLPMARRKRIFLRRRSPDPVRRALAGKIKAGSTSDYTLNLTDLFATSAGIINQELPYNAAEDSVSLLPVLLGTGLPQKREAVFIQGNGKDTAIAVCSGRWKLIVRYSEGEDNEYELYDLEADPGELTNVSGNHPDVTKRWASALETAEAAGRTRLP